IELGSKTALKRVLEHVGATAGRREAAGLGVTQPDSERVVGHLQLGHLLLRRRRGALHLLVPPLLHHDAALKHRAVALRRRRTLRQRRVLLAQCRPLRRAALRLLPQRGVLLAQPCQLRRGLPHGSLCSGVPDHPQHPSRPVLGVRHVARRRHLLQEQAGAALVVVRRVREAGGQRVPGLMGVVRLHGSVQVAAGGGEAGLQAPRVGAREYVAEGVERVERQRRGRRRGHGARAWRDAAALAEVGRRRGRLVEERGEAALA
uniref:Uncharacterized protein n=1 Tax=Triticum urartu TaxID=4572 RepID=A0A8R7UR05_TRIUA